MRLGYLILVLSPLIVLLISGCAQQGGLEKVGIGLDSMKDITNNLQNYENKEVTVKGTVTITIWLIT
jgi:outer membrane lipoprotein-sorting protein